MSDDKRSSPLEAAAQKRADMFEACASGDVVMQFRDMLPMFRLEQQLYIDYRALEILVERRTKTWWLRPLRWWLVWRMRRAASRALDAEA